MAFRFVLHEGFAVRPDIAVACGLAAAFVMNFFVARVVCVSGRRDRSNNSSARFALVSFAFRLPEYLVFLFLHNVFGIQYMIANASVLFLSFCLKFFVYKIFVFIHRDKQLQTV